MPGSEKPRWLTGQWDASLRHRHLPLEEATTKGEPMRAAIAEGVKHRTKPTGLQQQAAPGTTERAKP